MENKLVSRAQVREFLKQNPVVNGDALADAYAAAFKDIIQEVLEAEMDGHLGYSKYDWKNKECFNSRNGHTKKKVKTKFGEFGVEIPRDAKREFEPQLVKKHERRVNPSFDDMIISMFAKGMGTRDINSHMKKIYGIDVSAEMVSRITDKVLPAAEEWQNRPLDRVYPIVYLDGMVFRVREEGQVQKKTAYVVFGITSEGMKDVLGIWIGESESAKFWMSVLSDLKNRGVEDIFIACVDGLKGFEEAITAIYPDVEVQQCIIHQIRNSTRFVSYKHRKEFCGDLKEIYTAPNEDAALAALDLFEEKWSEKYGYAAKSWRNNWGKLSTFFKYPSEIRKIIYTTNPVESFNRTVRKTTKTKNAFTTERSLLKLLYLIVMDSSEKWTQSVRDWGLIVQQLNIHFGGRLEIV